MTKTIQATCGVVLTIRRPNGSVERKEDRRFSFGTIPRNTFAAMVKATAEAGRGDVISQEPLLCTMAAYEPTPAELAGAQYVRDHKAVVRVSANGRA